MQWPLAKLKIPIDYLIQRVERLLTGFANEISATQWYPATFDRRIKSSAKFLTERIAIYLAKEVAHFRLLGDAHLQGAVVLWVQAAPRSLLGAEASCPWLSENCVPS